ncbi:MAG: hypothetical protein MJY76_00930 [Bacteroidales bacterium]|nr:hypothetical protein [Bacteroidales bacterium]
MKIDLTSLPYQDEIEEQISKFHSHSNDVVEQTGDKSSSAFALEEKTEPDVTSDNSTADVPLTKIKRGRKPKSVKAEVAVDERVSSAKILIYTSPKLKFFLSIYCKMTGMSLSEFFNELAYEKLRDKKIHDKIKKYVEEALDSSNYIG